LYWESESPAADANRTTAGPSPGAVRAQLERIVSSADFANAPSLSRLLQHLVDHALSGRCDLLKEYVIGVDVFDRGPSFDPRTDTIVRVQARRLRGKLDAYYARSGRADPVVVEVPKGHYAAVFRATGSAGGSQDGRLPASCTPMIGREGEVAALEALLLSASVRLVTLTGVGGCGKTRLAHRVASEVRGQFAGGVHVVSLAFVTDRDGVVSTISQILGLRQTGGRPLAEALILHAQQRVRQRTLLLLDNFEHLVQAAPLLVRLLEAAAELVMLVTSRSVLHVTGEHQFPLLPLPLPDPDHASSVDDLSQNPAVALFVQRAVAASPAFCLTEDNAPIVAAICHRLDGLPLALELAAALVKMLPPRELLAKLQSPLELLTGGSRDLPLRQQTLRNTLAWSHHLLNAVEQQLFRRLSVFARGFTLEGAEAIGNTNCDLSTTVLEGVASLVDKNLLQRVDLSGEVSRFAMLETIREFGLEALTSSGELAPTRRAHAAYCLVLAEEGDGAVTAEQRTHWLTLCDAEHDNFRAALDYLTDSGDAEWALRLGRALFVFWDQREHLAEGRARLSAIVTLPRAAHDAKMRAEALRAAGSLANNLGDFEPAIALHREALDIYRELHDQRGVIAQLNSLGVSEHLREHNATARTWFERCLAACREVGDPRAIAAALNQLANVLRAEGELTRAAALLVEAQEIFQGAGYVAGVAWSHNQRGDVARDRGELGEARRLYEQGLAMFQDVGDAWGLGRSLADLGHLYCELGDHAESHSYFAQALGVFGDLGHQRGIANVLDGFARLAVRQRHAERALMLAAAASQVRLKLGVAVRPGSREQQDRTLVEAREQISPAAAAAASASGRRMSLEQACGLALGVEATCPSPTGSSPGR
jgi:predicted ATPase